MIDTYSFSGDAVTFLGLVGVLATFVIIVTAFRRFFNSPYNIRVTVPKVSTDAPVVEDSVVSYESTEET